MDLKKRWGSLAVGAVMMVLLGLIYAWSIFVAPLEAEFGWSRDETSLTFTVCMSFFVLGLITNGFLAKRISPRATLLIVAALQLAGFGLCSRVNTLPGLYLAYGVLVGFAVGIANSCLVGSLVKWFPDKVGTASGILMMGFGLGGMVLGSLAASLMRPESLGWRSTFLLFGVTFAAIFVLGSFVVKLPPSDFAEKHSLAPRKKGRQEPQNPDRSTGEVLRRPSFWLYIGWFTLTAAGGLIVIGHAAPFVGMLGATGTVAAVITGVLSLANGAGRVLSGVVYDRLGLRASMVLSCLYLFTAGTLLIVANQTGILTLVVVSFILTGLSYGSNPTTSSTFASGFYGMKHFAMNYAVASAGLIPAALLGPYLAGWLYTSSGGYLTSFFTMLAFAVVALIISRFIRKP